MMGFGETFRALSDPARREILTMLKKGRMSAGEIAACLPMTGATVSYHLKILKQADLLFETRSGTYIYYELNTSVLEDVLFWIADLRDKGQDSAAPDGQNGIATDEQNGIATDEQNGIATDADIHHGNKDE